LVCFSVGFGAKKPGNIIDPSLKKEKKERNEQEERNQEEQGRKWKKQEDETERCCESEKAVVEAIKHQRRAAYEEYLLKGVPTLYVSKQIKVRVNKTRGCMCLNRT